MTRDGIYAEVDDAARLLTVTVIGDVHDDRALTDVPAIWRRHPQVVDYDSLIDLTRDGGRISWGAIRKIAEQWNEFTLGRDHGRHTAIAVRNDQWDSYARVLATIFPRRAFKTFRSVPAAKLWIASRCDQRVRRLHGG